MSTHDWAAEKAKEIIDSYFSHLDKPPTGLCDAIAAALAKLRAQNGK